MAVGYQSEEKDGVHLITCPSNVDAQQFAIEPLVKVWLLSPSSIHIIDFSQVLSIKQNAYRAFIIFNQQLRGSKKKLFAMNASIDLQKQFRLDGLDSVFVPVASIEDAKKREGGKLQADAEFINPFIAATQKVLEIQARVPVTAGKPRLKKPDENLKVEIAGIISVSGKQFTGSFVLCFSAEVFLKIYESLTGEKWPTITTEIQDAAGELLNIIYGQAKTVLNDEKGYTFQTTLPTVMVGEKLRLHYQSRNPAIIIPLESPAGMFHLEILVERS